MEKEIQKVIDKFEKKKDVLRKLYNKTNIFHYNEAIIEYGYVTMKLEETKDYIEKAMFFEREAELSRKDKKFEMDDFLDMKIKENELAIDMVDMLNESIDEKNMDKLTEELMDHFRKAGIDVDRMDEGILGNLIGGLTGFFIGPAIGRVVARALGVTKGILFDMFNSKLVGAALGSAIVRSFKKKKKKK